MEESLVAATINAAASLGRAHSHGSLEPGKVADMLVIDAPRYMGLVPGGGGQKFHVIEGPNSFDHIAFCFPFTLSGSTKECWLHRCLACVTAILSLGLQTTLVARNYHTSSRAINTQKKNLANIEPSWPHAICRALFQKKKKEKRKILLIAIIPECTAMAKSILEISEQWKFQLIRTLAFLLK